MKTPDNYYKEASDELNLPIGLVKAVNKFFWKEGVKSNLSNVKYTSIFIKNFGTITVSKYKLYAEIHTLIKKIRRVHYSDKYTELRRGYIMDSYKINLRKLLKIRNEIIKQELQNEHIC